MYIVCQSIIVTDLVTKEKLCVIPLSVKQQLSFCVCMGNSEYLMQLGVAISKDPQLC